MGWLLKLGLAILLGVLIYSWLKRRIAGITAMPVAEARALLGVDESASLGDIREAHRRLIARVHPDTGGSAELGRGGLLLSQGRDHRLQVVPE